jgi:hypothetical protein
MSDMSLAVQLSDLMALPEQAVIQRGLLSLVEKEIRLAELEIAEIRERYDVFSLEALRQVIESGAIPGHPAWEDYIVWKNKQNHILRLRQMAEAA